MAKTKYSDTQLTEISKIQAQYGITRKSAIRRFEKQLKEAARAAAKVAKTSKARIEQEVHAKDHKSAAANDKPEVVVRTEAGSARAEGIALYKIAGRPSRQDFIAVYGQDGPKWTWERRAKEIGVATARAAAEAFQSALRAKQQASSAGAA